MSPVDDDESNKWMVAYYEVLCCCKRNWGLVKGIDRKISGSSELLLGVNIFELTIVCLE